MSKCFYLLANNINIGSQAQNRRLGVWYSHIECLSDDNWGFARARSTISFVREFWQMRIDLLIANKR